MKLEELGSNMLQLVESSKSIVIRNDEDMRSAEEVLGLINERKKNIKNAYDDLARSAYTHWKSICAKRDFFFGPADEQAKLLKGKIGEYLEKRRVERLEAERKLNLEAIEREQNRIIHEALNAPKDMQELILSQQVNVAPVVMPEEKSRVVFREIWNAEVYDLMALVKAVASGVVSIQAVEANSTYLRKKAEAEKAEMRVPGVRSYKRKV
jgi:hypothetical protein